MNARYLHSFPGGFALRRPWEQRAFLGLMGFMCLVVPLMMADDNLRPNQALKPGFWPEWAALTGMCLAGAAVFWWGSGPRELVVDEEKRTYRRSEGWPPFRRMSAGPLSDMAGVWAEAGSRSSLVYIGWQAGLGSLVVEQFVSAEAAKYYAAELADVLGVPSLQAKPPARVTG